jgi:hypothetical protein
MADAVHYYRIQSSADNELVAAVAIPVTIVARND